MITRFLTGFRAPFLGFRLIVANAGFWRLATMPYLIDLCLFTAGVYLGWTYIPIALTMVLGGGTEFWGQLVYFIVFTLSFLSFVVLLFCLVFFMTNLIASPFNALLAEKTLRHIGAIPDVPQSMAKWFKSASKMLLISLARSLIFISIAAVLFVLSLVPGLQLVAAFAGLLLMSFDCADFGFETFHLSLGQRMKAYRSHLAEFSGFACALGLTFVIPGLNLLLYPATVVGATLLVASIQGAHQRPDLKELR
jgi:CysZ protein